MDSHGYFACFAYFCVGNHGYMFICFWVGNHGYFEYFRCEHIQHRCECLSCIICISATSIGEDEKKDFVLILGKGAACESTFQKARKLSQKPYLYYTTCMGCTENELENHALSFAKFSNILLSSELVKSQKKSERP